MRFRRPRRASAYSDTYVEKLPPALSCLSVLNLQNLLKHLQELVTFYYSGSRSNKTFKPKKNIPEGTHQYDLMRHAAATLGSGNLRLAVMLPEGEDLNEWVAVNSEWIIQLHSK